MDFRVFTSAMLLYTAVSSVTPGPNNLTMLFFGAKFGFRKSLPFMTASMCSFLVKQLLCGLLNIVLANAIPKAIPYLKWIGAAYMVYLGLTMALSGFQKEKPEDEKNKSAAKNILAPTEPTPMAGIMLQCFNMKSWIAAISVIAVYVIPITSAPLTVFAVCLVSTLILTAASTLWGLFGSAIRRLVEQYRKPFGIICGLSLVYCAVTALL